MQYQRDSSNIWSKIAGSKLTIVKGKVKLSLCFNRASRHGSVLGERGIAPRILDLSTRWRWMVSFTPRPLYPQEKSPLYPLDRRLGGPQNRSGHGEGKIPSPARTRIPDHPAPIRALYHWAILALTVFDANSIIHSHPMWTEFRDVGGMYEVITNDVSDYINVLVRIAHIICNHTFYSEFTHL
jgi:hypothetical protein